MAIKVNEAMDLAQVMQTLKWLDEERRKDKAVIAALKERIEEQDRRLAQQAAQYLVEKQLPDGGWAMYPGGRVEISASVKAYFALKLTGHDPSAEYMQRARQAILAHGGADAVNSFTRFYLALLGQISYDQCPEVPPEMIFLPRQLTR